MARTWQKVRPLAKLTVLDNVSGRGAGPDRLAARGPRRLPWSSSDIVRAGAQAAACWPAALPIGERKKLEVARVLATGPELLLLDEVMGGLNTRRERGDHPAHPRSSRSAA
jgi:branched-chain amino acid transport system ATP-binding protein